MKEQVLQNDWGPLLQAEFNKPYFLKLRHFLNSEYLDHEIFPNTDDIFNALHCTSFEQVKVVILGQDPYHGPNQAQGLSFSVQPNMKKPPSLVNIFKELHNDIGCHMPTDGDLSNWANQGVLLLNTVLTVRTGQAHSHRNKGWEIFTDQVIKTLNQKTERIVYILWGAAAQNKMNIIDTNKHYIIKSPHPSPLSAYRGFFGSKPFSTTNDLLKREGLSDINWCQFQNKN